MASAEDDVAAVLTSTPFQVTLKGDDESLGWDVMAWRAGAALAGAGTFSRRTTTANARTAAGRRRCFARGGRERIGLGREPEAMNPPLPSNRRRERGRPAEASSMSAPHRTWTGTARGRSASSGWEPGRPRYGRRSREPGGRTARDR